MHEWQPVQMFGGYVRSFRLEMLNSFVNSIIQRYICDYNVKVVIIIFLIFVQHVYEQAEF